MSRTEKRKILDHKDWKRVRLRDVAAINPNRPSGLERVDSAATTFVPMEAVDATTGQIANPQTRTFGEIKKGYTYFAEGDVLFAKITPCMQNGKHCIARDLIDGIGFGTTEFHVLRPGPDVIPEWVHFFLRQPSVLQEATNHFTGAVGQQRVPPDYLGFLEIPLPPLAEQKRIAAILNEQMVAVERARKAAEERLKAITSLPRAYRYQVFGDHEIQAWPQAKIGDIAKVQVGYAFKSAWFSEDGVRLLRNANVFQGHIEWQDVVKLPIEQRSKFSAYELKEGNIVLSLDRPIVSGGLKVARITSEDLPALLLQRVARFCLSEDILVEYLYEFLNSPVFLLAITGHDQSLGVPHISPTQVEAIRIPFPPLKEQHRIVTILRKRITALQKVISAANEEYNTIKALSVSILRQAFACELRS